MVPIGLPSTFHGIQKGSLQEGVFRTMLLNIPASDTSETSWLGSMLGSASNPLLILTFLLLYRFRHNSQIDVPNQQENVERNKTLSQQHHLQWGFKAF